MIYPFPGYHNPVLGAKPLISCFCLLSLLLCCEIGRCRRGSPGSPAPQLTDLKSQISGVEELLEEFRKQLQQQRQNQESEQEGDRQGWQDAHRHGGREGTEEAMQQHGGGGRGGIEEEAAMQPGGGGRGGTEEAMPQHGGRGGAEEAMQQHGGRGSAEEAMQPGGGGREGTEEEKAMQQQLQEVAVRPSGDAGEDLCNFSQQEDYIIRTKDSLEAGATFLKAPSEVYGWKQCLEVCCSEPGCSAAVVESSGRGYSCFLFHCTRRGHNVCQFSPHRDYSSFTLTGRNATSAWNGWPAQRAASAHQGNPSSV